MKKYALILLTVICFSCENGPRKACFSRIWITDIIEDECIKTLTAYPILDSLNLTGAVDWKHLEQQQYVDADLWNLYDAVLIDSMIIYDSITILVRDSGRYRACYPNWFIYTSVDSSFEKNFVEQEGSEILNANWKKYLNKPVAMQ